ncbi:MAG: alkyl sulfatase dimerization domain-containing protein [Pseudomonadota bacterium]
MRVKSIFLLATLLGTPMALAGPLPATPATIAAQAESARALPAPDPDLQADLERGYLGSSPDAETRAADGRVVYTLKGYEFLNDAPAPATVHPGLWEQARKSMRHGLYRVTEGFYQVRGMDLTNMTIVEGKTGLIVIDPMMTAETAHAALELYYRYRPRKPVLAVFYNHSHVDHYGGVKGIVSEADVRAGKVQIIAPAGFMKSAVAENVMAGNAMSRRSEYQFGTTLPRGAQGQVDLGGAKALPNGTITLIPPTREISQPLETLFIDGVEIVNMLTPGTEAPAEMVHYFPRHKVLDTGELALPTQHQLLTLRGAEIRDGHAWSQYLNGALQRFGAGTEVLVGQHGWPVFGQQRVASYLSRQRDLYAWLHDQTLRLANHGFKPVEIAETLRASVPASLAGEWYLRGYYGSIQRNAKAVYQQYMGWYDGNPAHMDALSAVDYGRKFVAYGGGADQIIKQAQADFARGEYRWVAQAMDHVVHAEPANAPARELAAAAMEQLGYQSESAVERNAYLSAAMELRSAGKTVPSPLRTGSPDTIAALSLENIFDFMGVRLNAPKAEGKHLMLNWTFTDQGRKNYVLNLENCALTWNVAPPAPQAHATLALSRATLDRILSRQLAPREAMMAGLIKVEGDPAALGELLALQDSFAPGFELVLPLKR